MPDYLTAKGIELVREGRQYRVKGKSGLTVTGNHWYDHARQLGGNAIDYLMLVEGAGFKDAVAVLLKYYGDTDKSSRNPSPYDKNGVFRPPKKNSNDKRVISYLIEDRGISYDVLCPQIDSGRIYEAYGTRNCVFTGIDYDTNEVRYAFERSSLKDSNIMFESAGSDKKYSFGIPGVSDTAFVFESVIDLLGYLSMGRGSDHIYGFYLSLGGLGSIALDYFIRKWSGLRKIIFCLDRDIPADEAYARLGVKYAEYGYSVSRHAPVFKDWNMQLLRGGHSFPAPPVPWGKTP